MVHARYFLVYSLAIPPLAARFRSVLWSERRRAGVVSRPVEPLEPLRLNQFHRIDARSKVHVPDRARADEHALELRLRAGGRDSNGVHERAVHVVVAVLETTAHGDVVAALDDNNRADEGLDEAHERPLISRWFPGHDDARL